MIKWIRFSIIGSLAMLVHWLTVAILLNYGGVQPLLANCFGFITAFQISYIGHSFWTFTSHSIIPHSQTLRRFFLVALTSFLINEVMYSVLIYYTTLDYLTALAIVLVAVSLLTFFTSSKWAFR